MEGGGQAPGEQLGTRRRALLAAPLPAPSPAESCQPAVQDRAQI